MTKTRSEPRRKRNLSLAGSLAILVGIVGSAASALAAAPPAPTPVPPGPTVSAPVSCGGKYSRALAGGFSVPVWAPEIGNVTVRTKLMRTGRHSWEVDAVQLGPETGAILPYAYCTKLRGKQVTVSASVTVAGNDFGTATATCPEGTRAVSGGFDSPDFDLAAGHVITLTSMRVSDTGWQVTGINPDFDAGVSPGQLTAYAYCLRGKPRITTVSADAPVTDPDALTRVEVSCPAGTRALSGGFDGHVAVGENGLNASAPIESYRLPGRSGWSTSAVQAGDQPGTVTTYAYCEPKPPVPSSR